MKRILSGLGFLTFFLLFSCSTTTPEIKDDEGHRIDGSIAELSEIEINGVEQWVLMRGENIDNPVLLFLHGGPGVSEMPYVSKFNKNLEDNFVVINWDQRGAGKSYSSDLPVESMNIDQMVEDAHQLVLFLRDKFDKDRIFVVGHSWGSILGVELVQKYPEYFFAYVGVGQVVNMKDNELLSMQYTREEAARRQNKKAMEELSTIPDNYWEEEQWYPMLRTQRSWLEDFGGMVYGQNSRNIFVKKYLGPEHNLWDLFFHFLPGIQFTLNSMWLEIMEVDLLQNNSEFKVPVYFFTGRHDYNTPFSLTEEYFNSINAPVKEFFWFEESAHSPHLEEPGKFYHLMVKKVLADSL